MQNVKTIWIKCPGSVGRKPPATSQAPGEEECGVGVPSHSPAPPLAFKQPHPLRKTNFIMSVAILPVALCYWNLDKSVGLLYLSYLIFPIINGTSKLKNPMTKETEMWVFSLLAKLLFIIVQLVTDIKDLKNVGSTK